ncbi:hypothetical protein [Thiolinea disciformis]|uniref:hypothetical protein n=1 Tax=Thiolinea disciformis TaxID=125614 RepID=UPI000376131E|nr:hypothetical protein [Thiolinea disciformis]
MQIGPMMKLPLAASLVISTARADKKLAEQAAELIKQDRIRTALAQNPVLAHLAQQIAKQVRKGGKA